MAKGQENHNTVQYVENLKKSFKIVRRNKYLWVLGFLAGSSFTSFNYGTNLNGLFQQKINNSTNAAGHTPRPFDGNLFITNILNWCKDHWFFILIIAIALTWFFLLWLSFQ